MTTTPIAILGGGHMGRALVGGLVSRGFSPPRIAVGEARASERAALAREYGVRVSADNVEAIAGARLVILAVKPQDVRAALGPLGALLAREPCVVLSVAAGVRVSTLQQLCGRSVPVVRAMPNRPALVGAGATAMFAPAEVPDADRALAEEAMRAVGSVVWLEDESAIDVVTALSGSGPAYFFLLAELMSEAAAGLGLDRAIASELAAQTLYGAGQLAKDSNDLARLREEVTSPGGTTEAALRTYEAGGLRAIVARALAAATKRSRELAKQASS